MKTFNGLINSNTIEEAKQVIDCTKNLEIVNYSENAMIAGVQILVADVDVKEISECHVLTLTYAQLDVLYSTTKGKELIGKKFTQNDLISLENLIVENDYVKFIREGLIFQINEECNFTIKLAMAIHRFKNEYQVPLEFFKEYQDYIKFWKLLKDFMNSNSSSNEVIIKFINDFEKKCETKTYNFFKWKESVAQLKR